MISDLLDYMINSCDLAQLDPVKINKILSYYSYWHGLYAGCSLSQILGAFIKKLRFLHFFLATVS